jgi:hypothetical protein
MPVILTADRAYAWLDPDATEDELLALLEPLPIARMKVKPASRAINSPKVDYPDLLNLAHTGAAPATWVKSPKENLVSKRPRKCGILRVPDIRRTSSWKGTADVRRSARARR